jgi:hypothetical protein
MGWKWLVIGVNYFMSESIDCVPFFRVSKNELLCKKKTGSME